jgi:hypothetical protein
MELHLDYSLKKEAVAPDRTGATAVRTEEF